MTQSFSPPMEIPLSTEEDGFDEQQSYSRKSLNRARAQRQSHGRTTYLQPTMSYRATSSSTATGIPMPSYHIQRTESELQLHEDMAMAEYRDRCMFNRLVTGIRRQQQEHQHYDSQLHQFYPDPDRDPSNLDDAGVTTHDHHDSHLQPIMSRGGSRSSAASANDAFSMITPIASDGEETGQGRSQSRPAATHVRVQMHTPRTPRTKRDEVDDWAIEGFDDTPRSPMALPARIFPDVDVMTNMNGGSASSRSLAGVRLGSSISSLHNDQLFVMDL